MITRQRILTSAKMRSIVPLLLFILVSGEFGQGDGIAMEIGDVTEILKFGRDVIVDVLESWEYIRPKTPNESGENDFPFIKRMEKRLTDKIWLISNKIESFEERSVQRTEAVLETILRKLPEQEKLDKSLHDLSNLVGRIEDAYSDFLKYARAINGFEEFTMEKFATYCVSPNGGIPSTVRAIHRLIVPIAPRILDRSILGQLTNSFQEASAQICNEQQSPQQLLYNLYNSIALTEIKGYAMMQFSWILLRLYKKGNFNEEMNQLKEQYMTRTSETLRAVKTAMAFAPRDLWRCDPIIHQEDVTFTELKQLFQSYIVNEVDLNTANTCRENCGYYNFAKVNGCYQNQFCSRQRRCNGNLYNCQYVDSDMWVCPAAENSTRRYEYIEYENGRIFGQKSTCAKGTMKVDSWWRWVFWHCSYCVCFCDDYTSNADRYFNLRNVTSDIQSNRVITGIKLTKKNKIVHIQIQEGELLPEGAINAETVHWKPVEDYTVVDGNVRNGRDYHTLSWEHRELDLDDLQGPTDHVLTGVRFRLLGHHLNFEIMTTPFNYTTGKLIKPLEKSMWQGNDNTAASLDQPRTALKIEKPDVPTRANAPGVPDSKSDQYLWFAPTDLEKDAAQSTIPFLDIQAVTPNPPVPLSGAGIIHKGRKGYGGYVAPKLITYDFTPHLRVELPSSKPDSILNNEVAEMVVV